MAFRVFEHTADIGLEAEGGTLEELFSEAARGLFSIIRGDTRVADSIRHPIALQADRLDRLFVAWLEEFIFLQDAEGIVFHDVHDVAIRETSGGLTLQAHVSSEAFSHSKHPGCVHVKAVTRHELAVSRPEDGRGAQARVILDI